MAVPAPGDIVAEKYRVDRLLAQGGMGVVVAARHTALGTQVAIKCLVRPAGLLGEEAANRFTREARAAASIESDHVCRVFDVGVIDGTPYMIMEYLDGHDLEGELEKRGRLEVGEAVALLMQAIDGVAAAHALGIVHRDLKPANLFLTSRPDGSRRVKVVDFGISKVEGIDAKLTDTQGSFGTPLYMSPEQVKNAKHADLRTDIWALGAILYELLAGRPPFQGETSGEIFAAVLESSPTPIREIVPSVPEEVAAIITKCLSRDREARFPTARALLEALAPFADPLVGGSDPLLRVATPASVPLRPKPPSTPTLAESDASIRLVPPSTPTVAESEASMVGVVGRRTSGWARAEGTSGRRTGLIIGAASLLVAVVAVGAVASRGRTADARQGAASPPASAAASEPAPQIPHAPLASADPLPAEEVSAPIVAASARIASAPAAPTSAARASVSAAAVRSKAPPAPRAAGGKTPDKKSAAEILKDSY